MACRAAWQRPLNSFQMVLQQNATLFGDADQDCPSPQRINQRFNILIWQKE